MAQIVIEHPGEIGTIDDIRMHGLNWSAVFTGAIAALVIQMLLSLLGIGLGLSTYEVTSVFSIPVLWWGGSGVVSAFFGGMVAGGLSGALFASAITHALSAWAIATLAVLSVVGSAGAALMTTVPTFGVLSETTDQTGPETVAAMAIYSFISLAVGAIAATLGGCAGARSSH